MQYTDLNHTSCVAATTPTDRSTFCKSVRIRFAFEVIGGVFVFSRCFLKLVTESEIFLYS